MLIPAAGRAQVTFNGVQTTLGSGILYPDGVAVDGSGNVFVADYGNNAVKEILAVNGSIPASPIIRTLASGNFDYAYGVAVDGSDNVYIADTLNGRVLKETLSAGAYLQTVIANSATNGLDDPKGVAVDGSGNVYIADTYNGRVLKETLSAANYTQSVVAIFPNNDSISPNGVAVDGETIYARLYTNFNRVQTHADYTYTAAP